MKFPGIKHKDNLSPIPHENIGEGKKEWFEAFGAPTVNANRWFLISMALAVCLVALSIAFAHLFPLKTVVPYIVSVDQSGYVSADSATAQHYVPGEAEKRYFLAKWVRDLYTIDNTLTVQYLKDDYSVTMDKAIPEFKDFMHQDNPLQQLSDNPQTIRTVTINSVSFVSSSTALIRFVTEKRNADGSLSNRTMRLAAIDFKIIPPTTAQEILTNPIGLFIDNFDITDDTNSTGD
ncbi:MAG: type IV secretion system protein [Pseudomonadota bacterium]|nr:type IV secretion system protein [Pseudomonadota bacterium]